MNIRKYQYLFGPVPSRRLGLSLGVDLVPHKVCSLNCIYCECGRTTLLTVDRKEYVPAEAVISELADYLSQSPSLDYITFSGSGEPTLHSGIGDIVRYLKDHFPEYRIALLSNSTLFHRPEVIEAIRFVDLIIPSLDAASEEIFEKINRPHSSLRLNTIVDGLIDLRKKYAGQIWLEIFIIPGMNDFPEEIERFRHAIEKIQPDRVQLNALDRPGAEKWVEAADRSTLQKIVRQLNVDADIIADYSRKANVQIQQSDIQNAIVRIISRRPCTVADLSVSLGLHPLEVNKHVDILLRDHVIHYRKMKRGAFLKLTK